MSISKQEILDFWFKECKPEQWYQKNVAFDAMLQERFGEHVELALKGELDHWAEDGEGCLALILMLDQFTRNIYRDTPKAFAGDEKAIKLSQSTVSKSYIEDAPQPWRQFMLMPMMHSEELSIQDASLPLFEQYTNENTHEFAVKHRDIIAQYGRFPHRNAILGRVSTKEELAFLEKPGSSF